MVALRASDGESGARRRIPTPFDPLGRLELGPARAPARAAPDRPPVTPQACLRHDTPQACLRHDTPQACLRHDTPQACLRHDTPQACLRHDAGASLPPAVGRRPCFPRKSTGVRIRPLRPDRVGVESETLSKSRGAGRLCPGHHSSPPCLRPSTLALHARRLPDHLRTAPDGAPAAWLVPDRLNRVAPRAAGLPPRPLALAFRSGLSPRPHAPGFLPLPLAPASCPGLVPRPLAPCPGRRRTAGRRRAVSAGSGPADRRRHALSGSGALPSRSVRPARTALAGTPNWALSPRRRRRPLRRSRRRRLPGPQGGA